MKTLKKKSRSQWWGTVRKMSVKEWRKSGKKSGRHLRRQLERYAEEYHVRAKEALGGSSRGEIGKLSIGKKWKKEIKMKQRMHKRKVKCKRIIKEEK